MKIQLLTHFVSADLRHFMNLFVFDDRIHCSLWIISSEHVILRCV